MHLQSNHSGNMARVSVTAEVVGTGSDGTEPSLLFSVQRLGLYSDDVKVLKRYLFNCGEGTQRLAGENGIKLSSLDAMYFTHFDIKSVSGVPGVIFALGSCGAATLTLHGPVGLRGFLGSIRSFVRRKYPKIQCVEIRESGDTVEQDGDRGVTAPIESETWNEGDERTDQHALIIPVALGISGVGRIPTSKSCLLCQKNAPNRNENEAATEEGSALATSSQINGKVHDSQSGRRRDDESDEHERCRVWLVQYYTAKVPAKIPYVDVVLNRYRGRYDDLKSQLCEKYGPLPDENPVGPGNSASNAYSNSDSSSDNDSDDGTTPFDFTARPLDRRWLEKFYEKYQPEKMAHIDRVLRQFSSREDTLKQMLTEKYGEKLTTTTSALHDRSAADDGGAPSKKRKLLTDDNHDDAPHERLIPKIFVDTNGFKESPSETVSNSMCYILQFQYTPYPVVWVIDCRSEENVADLVDKFSNDCCGGHVPSLVVHLSPPRVQSQQRYQQWMARLHSLDSHPEQLIFDGGGLQSVAQGAFSFAFVSSAKAAVRMELQRHSATNALRSTTKQAVSPAILNLAKYLEEALWSAELPCRRRVLRRIEGCEGEAHVAQSKLLLTLMHPKAVPLGFNSDRIGWHQRADKGTDEEMSDNATTSTAYQEVAQAPCTQQNIASARKLIVLGTGSAAPSKLRASSGIYLELSGTNTADVESMLVDCGEGTFGQLWRQFGSEVSRRIGGLRCIWISHNHADHHCGLVRVLYEYRNFHKLRNSTRPIVVIAPQSVLSYVASWLPQFLSSDSDQQLIRLVTCSDFNDPRHPLRSQLLSDIGYAVTSLLSVRVFHCYDSYGLVLTLQGGKKLVYSGDTKPCNELVLAGMGAELLVHEATFDDSMEQDAAMKKHSTVGQALDIARRMRARQVVLTHFSQRYPSLPPPVSGSNEGAAATSTVLCAYDGFVHAMPF